MRIMATAAITVASVGFAWHEGVFLQFLGAMLGAFVATLLRNDKRRIHVIVNSAVREHENAMHKKG